MRLIFHFRFIKPFIKIDSFLYNQKFRTNYIVSCFIHVSAIVDVINLPALRKVLDMGPKIVWNAGNCCKERRISP